MVSIKAILTIIIIGLIVLLSFYRTKIIGLWGEKKISFLLWFLGSEYKTYNDVLIKKKSGHTTQIDHLVISPYGIFVIETKNYTGWITGGAHNYEWTQNIWGHKYSLTNPIFQNENHIKALESVLPLFSSNQYISIVVFLHHSTLKVKVAREDNVIPSWKLLFRIKSYKDYILSDEQQDELIAALEEVRLYDKESRKKHVSAVKSSKKWRKQLESYYRCPLCGGTLILREGPYGKFYGCSKYPKCQFTKKA